MLATGCLQFGLAPRKSLSRRQPRPEAFSYSTGSGAGNRVCTESKETLESPKLRIAGAGFHLEQIFAGKSRANAALSLFKQILSGVAAHPALPGSNRVGSQL